MNQYSYQHYWLNKNCLYLSLVIYWNSIAFVFCSFLFWLEILAFFLFHLTCLILSNTGVKSLWILFFTSGDLAFPSLVYVSVYCLFISAPCLLEPHSDCSCLVWLVYNCCILVILEFPLCLFSVFVFIVVCVCMSLF